MRSIMLPMVMCALAACGDGAAQRRLGSTCEDSGECTSGLCYESLCLDPSADPDGDGLTNAQEAALGLDLQGTDSDGDGTADKVELGAGGAGAPADSDHDGKIDALESDTADSDGDCIPDARDPTDDPPGTCDTSSDSDHDGLTDAVELALGTDPQAADSDDDGEPDSAEVVDGKNVDSDGDGMPDALESAIADGDNDCLADEVDPHNGTADPGVACCVQYDAHPWTILFQPRFDMVSACTNGASTAPPGWAALDVFTPTGGGAFSSPMNASAVSAVVAGTLTRDGFAATITCQSGGVPAGTLTGTLACDRFTGSYALGAVSGNITVLRCGTPTGPDPACIGVR